MRNAGQEEKGPLPTVPVEIYTSLSRGGFAVRLFIVISSRWASFPAAADRSGTDPAFRK